MRLASLVALTVVAAFIAFRVSPQQTATQLGQPWDAGTRYVGWAAPSTLEIINDCKKEHSFSVTKENAGFLDFLFTSPVTVPPYSPKKTNTFPVRFHTDGMQPGDYTGTVTVQCLDCAEVPPCTQDRRLLSPHIRVVARPGTAPSDGTQTTVPSCSVTTKNCDDIKAQLDELDGLINQQKKTDSDLFNDAIVAITAFSYAEQNLNKASEDAINGFDTPQAAKLRAAVQGAEKDAADKFDAYQKASAASLEAAAHLSDLHKERTKLQAMYNDCLSAVGACQQEGPPQVCTRDSPCTKGWTDCNGDTCGPPQICTPDAPCTGGSTVQVPPPNTSSTCTQDKEDCEQLRLFAERKRAAAAAAQATADAAAADANAAEKAAANPPSGMDMRDAAALQERAIAERANAHAMQQAANDAKAAAAAAELAAEECAKRKVTDCPQVPGQTVDTTGGPSTGTTSKPPCPQENCEPLRLAWQEAERQAAIAQVLADRAAANQAQNQADANYYDSVAQSDDAYATGQTDRAKQMRALAAGSAGLEKKDLEIAARSPAGSKDRAEWEKAAAEDHADIAKWNDDAAAAEVEEIKYHEKAAEERALAAQLRAGANGAQANADAAKAAAAAAKKAYDDCLARNKAAQEECDKKAAAVPHTTSRPPAGGTPPPTGGTSGGSTVGTTAGTGGGTTTRPGANRSKIGTDNIPDPGHRIIDPLDTTLAQFCRWVKITLPSNTTLQGVYVRNPDGSPGTNSHVEAREGARTTFTAQPTIDYHCMSENGTAIITYTYEFGSERRIGRMLVSCTAR
jgi:hypothetical protein